MLNRRGSEKKSDRKRQGDTYKPWFAIKPRDCRCRGSDDQRNKTTHTNVYPEEIRHLCVVNLLPLHGCRRKPYILKNPEKSHHGRYHGIETEILWCKQARQHHNKREV